MFKMLFIIHGFDGHWTQGMKYYYLVAVLLLGQNSPTSERGRESNIYIYMCVCIYIYGSSIIDEISWLMRLFSSNMLLILKKKEK